ncbi:TPA: hypothetical protein CPU00_06110 [Candidatus Gastranaerophilales bacterium HUM_18]|nr:MAG TPA: hypothetical protein CPU00_06110 [Candidatus Gastranaerophilales bacterium HUM_18]
MPKVSVIIPVYNTEKFLRKCLDSVCNQTLQDIEIICINDCSTDGSLEILREYARKDNRIKLIELLENCGAAKARNIGIDIAEGEYLGFIDSDDYIDLDFYENLYAKAIETSADVVKGSDMLIIWQNGRKEIDKQNEKIKKNKINFWSQYTTAIYKRVFILENNIEFPAGLLVGEDPVFAIKCAFLSNKIDIINNAQYYYMRRDESLNSEYWSLKKVKSYIKYIEIVTDFVLKLNIDEKSHRTFFGWLLNDIYCTRETKKAFDKSYEKILTEFYKRIQKKVVKYPLKLLFDATIFVTPEKRGIYWVSYNILKELKKDNRFEITLWLERNWINKDSNNDEVLKDLKCVYSNIRLGKAGDFRLLKNNNFTPEDYDAYLNTSHNAQLKFNSLRPMIFNVLHDVIPMLKDNWFPVKHKIDFWKFHNNLSSDINCFCVSQNCKDGFIRFFDKLNPDKMIVTYNSTAQKFYPIKNEEKLKYVLNKYNVPQKCRDKYIFYFGAADDPRKNLMFCVGCFLKFIKKYNINNLYFYIGGSGGDTLKKKLKIRYGNEFKNMNKYIITLGFIDDEDVNILYSNSLFFTFISLYEGFGMPPLEAMQAGVPVICANNSSLPEVVGDAAIMVNAENEKEIIEAFSKFYFNEELRNEYVEKGLARAKLFSWDKTVKIMTDKMIGVLSEEH